jgi:hypothetical protein
MATNRHHPTPEDPSGHPSQDEFEELVAAALKVDPAGLSGKHWKESEGDRDEQKGDG